MKLNNYFKQFLGSISLNPTRVSRIDSALSNWKNNFQSHENTKDKLIAFYVQGSFASDTAIKPQSGNDFDVDVILLLDFDDSITSREAIKYVADTIKSYSAYTDRVTTLDRCVRINYADDFHVDIVPARPTDEHWIEIPSKKDDEWKETNPKGFTEWCKEINSEFQGQFIKIAKLIKYWRDDKVGKDTAPKSILLTTLIGQNMVYANSVAESLVLTLEEMVDNLDNILVDDIPSVENPSLEGENLARKWTKEKYDIFKTKLSKFASDARSAHDDDDKDASIQKWSDIFDRFPTELSEGANTSSDIAKGSVLISSTGALNRTEGSKIPEHRFFGE